MSSPDGQITEVLLVEDDPADMELALRVLKRFHPTSRIQVAGDGQEALDFVFGRGEFEGRSVASGPKVVLLDLKLPRVNGFEVLKTMKTDERTRRIPIVVMTSSREERDLLMSYDLGVNSYVVKPVEYSQFTDSLSRLGFYWTTINKVPGNGR